MVYGSPIFLTTHIQSFIFHWAMVYRGIIFIYILRNSLNLLLQALDESSSNQQGFDAVMILNEILRISTWDCFHYYSVYM